MEPIHYLRAFRRRWLVVVVSVVVAVGAAWLTTATIAPIAPPIRSYTATTVLWQTSSIITGTSGIISDPGALARLATLPDVAVAAAERLNFDGNPLELRGRVTAIPAAEGGFLEIRGVSQAPKEAVRIAEAFAASLQDYLEELQKARAEQQANDIRLQIAELQEQGADKQLVLDPLRAVLERLAIAATEPVNLTIIQHATPELVPVTGFQAPKSEMARLLIAAIFGLLAGLGLALILERFDTRIRTRAVAEERFGYPVLVEVPVMSRHQREVVTVADQPTGGPSDSFRLLAAGVTLGARSLSLAGSPDGNGRAHAGDGTTPDPTTVLVTSSGPGDGKTTVAANLAAAYGELGKRVVLIACDLRRPTVHRLFGVPVEPGLADVLTAEDTVALDPLETEVRNVAIVPSGIPTVGPGQLLGSERMRHVLEEARRSADVVVLDTSPVLVASDVTPLLSLVDAVVLVAKANSTTFELAERTGDTLRQLNAPVVGVALNKAKEISMPTAYRRYYHHRPAKPPVTTESEASVV